MNPSRSAIVLPFLLQRRLEKAAADFLDEANAYSVDFSRPHGEAALVPADSFSWRVFKSPVALFLGGIAAVVLELAEPRISAGVWNHTSFQRDPLRRIQRTGFAAMVTVYGPRSTAEAMIRRVSGMHARIGGTTPDGKPYRADDPELLSWVYATASFGFIEAYNAYVRRLAPQDFDRFYGEGRTAAALYGAKRTPGSRSEMAALFADMQGVLEPSGNLFEFLRIMERVPVLPPPLHRMQRLLVNAAVELLPPPFRRRLELSEQWSLQPWQRRAVAAMGALSDRILLAPMPAVQACRRMGLPDDYLYRSHQSS
jgi:uncharacterized protein (DUF2236 family)